MGILHITNAVSFLNNDCKLVRAVRGEGEQGLIEGVVKRKSWRPTVWSRKACRF
jgi:hypothetical protein